MKYQLLALLSDRPDDIDWSVLDLNHPAVKWAKDYYNTYSSLPTVELFAQECLESGESAIPAAPWQYYVKEAKDVKFVEDAVTYLEVFNKSYAGDPKAAILALKDEFTKLAEPKKVTAPADIAAQTSERWARFALRKGARIKLGIQPFDDASGGISPDDEFMILSARLGIGKSMLAHYIALSMAKQGLVVGLYSGEMSEDEVGARVDSWLTHVSNFDLTRGKLTDAATQMAAYTKEVSGRLLVVTPKHLGHNATPGDLRKFIKEHNLSVLLIDQLSLMQPDGKQSSEMFQQFANLSLQLKSLQQEQRIPIIAVSQLNRAAQEQEVNAANISGSDRIGQDATIILSLERKENELIMKVLKARSFKRPDKGWTFQWDIDTGILVPQITALDTIQARKVAAKKADAEAAKQVSALAGPAEYGRSESDDNEADYG